MPRITMLFGGLLIALGLYSFVSTGSAHPTALIPAYFGIVLLLCGALAQNETRRALWMHIAVTAGLLGFVVPLIRIVGHWATMAGPARFSIATMAGLCLVFTALCVRSFIVARVLRKG